MHARHCLPALFEEFEQLNPLANVFTTVFQPDNLPGVNMAETDEAILVEVPVPGCSEEKIHVTYERGSLLITAAEEEVREEKQVKYLLKSSRNYSYRIPIPSRIDEQVQPEATYNNGVLKVVFPKSRASRPMKISVKK